MAKTFWSFLGEGYSLREAYKKASTALDDYRYSHQHLDVENMTHQVIHENGMTYYLLLLELVPTRQPDARDTLSDRVAALEQRLAATSPFITVQDGEMRVHLEGGMLRMFIRTAQDGTQTLYARHADGKGCTCIAVLGK